MNLMTSGVVSGLVGAATKMKLSDVSMGIYQVESKKLHPDTGKMQRALGYACDSMKDAKNEKDKTGTELEKAQIEAHEEEKAQNAADVQNAGNTNTDKKVVNVSKDGDTAEISEAGKAAAASDVKTEDHSKVKASPNEKHSDTKESEPEVYLPSGKAKAVKVHMAHKVSVTA